jgi:hypothetical protein
VITVLALDTFNYCLGGPKHVLAARALERKKKSINAIFQKELEPSFLEKNSGSYFFAVFLIIG